jgi:PAS domain S-box-containing protein
MRKKPRAKTAKAKVKVKATKAKAGARSTLKALRERLHEVESTLEAIRSGAVDALVISGPTGEQVFTLKGADHRYRRLVETMNEGAAVVRPDGLIIYCNSRFAAMLGRPHGSVVGMVLPDLATLAARSAVEALVRRAERGTARAEVEMVTRDGGVIPVYLSATPNNAEETPGISMIATDLSDQRRNARVVAAERLTASIIEQASEALVVCDCTGRVIRASQAARRLLGGNPVLDRFVDAFSLQPTKHPTEPVSAYATRDWITDAIAGQSFAGIEVVLSRDDGSTATLLLSAGPLVTDDAGIIGCVVSLVDISARRDVEERLRRALAEELTARQQLEEMAARERQARRAAETATRVKDEFLATVSHELRTPLSAIVGWTAILRAGRLSEDRRDHALGTIERNARAQTQLIDDLLDVSRIISGKLRLDVERVDLAAVLRNAVDAVQPTADAKDIRLQTILDPEASAVSGDPDRLQQVIWNLLANALKFTPKGGTVRAQLRRDGSEAEIVVEDTGQGIAADFLPYVFDRFRQAEAMPDRTKAGLGLGLAIVRHLVEQHGGTVTAHSDGRDRGASFVIRIPIASLRVAGGDRSRSPGDVDVTPVRDNPALAPRLDGVRVLIVDDENDGRELLLEVLRERGAEVCDAHSAREGLTLIQAQLPDVLVSDIGMPGEDGLSFIKAVRALPADKGGLTPAVALTGYARTQDRTEALRAGFNMHLAKPVSPAELLAVVGSLAGRAAALRAPSARPGREPIARAFKPTLLLIEDAPDIQEVLSELLTDAGYQVIAAAHGGEGLDRLRTGPPIHLILLDLMMPVMDGWRFREEQLHDPNLASIPVVVISANANQNGRPIHANAVVPKPVDIDQLLKTVDAYTRVPVSLPS